MRNQTRHNATNASPARERQNAETQFAPNSSLVVASIWLAFYVIAAVHSLTSAI